MKRLKCDGSFNDQFIAIILLSVPLKEFFVENQSSEVMTKTFDFFDSQCMCSLYVKDEVKATVH